MHFSASNSKQISIVNPHDNCQRKLRNSFSLFRKGSYVAKGKDIVHLIHLGSTMIHSIWTETVLFLYFLVLFHHKNWKTELYMIASSNRKKDYEFIIKVSQAAYIYTWYKQLFASSGKFLDLFLLLKSVFDGKNKRYIKMTFSCKH